MRHLLASLVLLAPMLSAQTLVTVPTSIQGNVNIPFASGTGRYQQWHPAWALQAGFATPVRLDQMEFFAGLFQTNTQWTLDMEVSIAHGFNSGLTGLFDNNYADTPVVVWPRQTLQLNAGAPTTVVMTIPFVNQFTWDRVRPIVFDIKVFGNSNNNQPFQYNNLGTSSGLLEVARCYHIGLPGTPTGTPQQNTGLIVRIRGRDGALLEYGTGCPGDGNFVPDNVIQNLPWPGISWSHSLVNAASQRPCIWMIGDDNQNFGSLALPLDIGAMLGGWSTGCMLRQNAVATLWSTTVGGGPGSGTASVTISMPPVTFYIGMSLYTQWFVLDPNAPSGMLSATEGGWAIVAPIGG